MFSHQLEGATAFISLYENLNLLPAPESNFDAAVKTLFLLPSSPDSGLAAGESVDSFMVGYFFEKTQFNIIECDSPLLELECRGLGSLTADPVVADAAADDGCATTEASSSFSDNVIALFPGPAVGRDAGERQR